MLLLITLKDNQSKNQRNQHRPFLPFADGRSRVLFETNDTFGGLLVDQIRGFPALQQMLPVFQ